MPYLNAVVGQIEAGCVASHDGETPKICKRCVEVWPCKDIQRARNKVRRLHGVKAVT